MVKLLKENLSFSLETIKQLGEVAGTFIATETAKQGRKVVVGC